MAKNFTLIYSASKLVYLGAVTKLRLNQFGNLELSATVFQHGSSGQKEGSTFALTLLLGAEPKVTFEPIVKIVHIWDDFGTQHNFATFDDKLWNDLKRAFPDA